MVAKHFKEIVAWQLAHELHSKIVAVLSTPSAARHFKFCDQMLAAAASVHNNIAEGFKRYNPPEFARFLTYARGSLAELSSQLEQMKSLGIGTSKDHASISLLIARCAIASARLQAYLRKCKPR